MGPIGGHAPGTPPRSANAITGFEASIKEPIPNFLKITPTPTRTSKLTP